MNRSTLPDLALRWGEMGTMVQLAGHEVFIVDIAPTPKEEAEPLLVLHGFPTSSFDFHLVVGDLARTRRVVLFDMVGYGLSEKPDIPITISLQADVASELTSGLGITELSMLTHDMGDTVGGELLARQMEGRWPIKVAKRVLTNGSIYIEMAHLTAGQQFLLSLPDQRLDPETTFLDPSTLAASLAATFSPSHQVPAAETEAAAALVCHGGGHLLLPRTIRYIEERRRHQSRFTGAIETHPSPLAVVWGADDPVAVPAMVDRLIEARFDASRELLHGVGHYPMIEAPRAFAEAVLAGLGPNR